ncbi:MAG: hypothetical protein IPP59_02330 [Betaproteobacteria bacterium]|nr:hypothetical protein [Candidatus Dechloromonas phosphorivorans]
MDYTEHMIEIIQSETFARWLGKLKGNPRKLAAVKSRIFSTAARGSFT